MNAPFPTRLPIDVLDRSRQVSRVTIDPRFCESAIQDLAGRADEGFAAPVLLVARPLTRENQGSVFATFTENRLGRTFVKWTGLAIYRSLPLCR